MNVSDLDSPDRKLIAQLTNASVDAKQKLAERIRVAEGSK